MKVILHVPLFVIVLIVYNFALLANRDGFKEQTAPAKPNTEQAVPATPAPAAVPAAETAPAALPAEPAPAPGAAPAAAPQAPVETPKVAAPVAATPPAMHPLDKELFSVSLPSKAKMPVSAHEFLLILAVFFLYIELFKSTRTANATIVEHVLSLLVFMAFFVELIVFRPAGTPTFLIMTLLSFLDVIAGFTITISTARRDFGMGGHAADGN